MIQKFPDNKSLICYPGNSHQIWIKRIFSIQSFERICLLNIFKSLTTSWGTRPPVQKETKWKKDIRRLIHKFYPKMNGSCLGVQLHWHPIRFKISWVLQLSHRFHRTMLVKISPPQALTSTPIVPITVSNEPPSGKGSQGISSSQNFSFLSDILSSLLSSWQGGELVKGGIYNFSFGWTNQWIEYGPEVCWKYRTRALEISSCSTPTNICLVSAPSVQRSGLEM